MPKSASSRAGDGRAIINLVGECRELGDHWEGWLGHLNRGLMRLTDAYLNLSGEISDPQVTLSLSLSPPVITAQAGFTADQDRVREAAEYGIANHEQLDFVVKYLERMSVDDGVALHMRATRHRTPPGCRASPSGNIETRGRRRVVANDDSTR